MSRQQSGRIEVTSNQNDLATEENIRKKAWEQVGFTQELLTSDMDFKLTFLALSPKIGESEILNNMLTSRLNREEDNKSISIVFENKAEEFATQLSLELKAHPETD